MKDNKKSNSSKRIKLFNKKFYGLTPFLFFLCLILMLPVIAQAASITMIWDRNQEPDIAGYRIYYGTQSGEYNNSITVVDSATQPLQLSYTVAGLSEGTAYYFALKTFDQAGQESDYSVETSQNIPGADGSQSTESVPGDCLINGTIEDGFSEPFGWRLDDWVPPGQESNLNPGLWTSQEVHSGAFSLMVNNETGSRVNWKGEQIRFAEPYPRTLTFGGWSKALDVDPDNWIYGLIFKICFADSSYTWFYPDAIQFDPGTHDWQLRQVTKTWDRAVVAVEPYAVLYDGTGTVWFDDIFVIPEPDNILYNGTLELGKDGFSEPFGWKLDDWVPPGQESNLNPGLWTSQEVHSGAFSLMVNNETGSRVNWKGEQIRFAEPYPRTLTFGGWSKALDVDPDNWIYGLIFKICFADGSYTWFYPDAIQFDPGTHDWQLRQVTKTWDRAVVAVEPYAVLYDGTGTVWFDDIFVIPEPDNILYNGTLELGKDGFSEPFGWRLDDWVRPGQESNLNPGLWTSQEVHSGAFSLMVNNETGSRVNWKGEQIRFAEPYPRTLTFGGWSKALDVDPDNWIYGLIFKICFADGSYTWFYPDAIQFDPGTHDWQLRQVTKTWDRAVVAVEPYAVLYDGTGTVWFDDIFVQVN